MACSLLLIIGISLLMLLDFTCEGSDGTVLAGWMCRYSDGNDYQSKLLTFQQILLKRLEESIGSMREHVQSDPDQTMGRVFEQLSMFILIDKKHEGSLAVSMIIQKYAADSLERITSQQSNLDFRFAIKSGKICEFVKGLATWCRQQTTQIDVESFGVILSRILLEADGAMTMVIRNFISERQLFATVEAQQEGGVEVNIRDVDLLVTEIALLIQNCMVLEKERWSILERINSGNLITSVSDLLTCYSKVEQVYLQHGIKMVMS